MTEAGATGGKIVTFYSFKGGVGRTMALANVAFIAAMNGKRVLVMDWDLEAPGLAYYFRGMQEPAAAKAIRTAPGILNLVWDWSVVLHGATTLDETDELLKLYETGKPFEAMVTSLLPEFEYADSGALHHIGAGSRKIATPDIVSYEEALARFDWRAFFTEEAGGVLLSSLREWAKDKYDYIFLDSRTGFADVAGICTMQIPDLVALCYIYNRQNIDGIAQVAGAIRGRRGDEVAMRAVPMRVSRENTSEEADARGRARKELVRQGGFVSDQVEIDQKMLPIKQALNVPFYETIALIASERPRSDPLVLDYVNLACQLLGTEFEVPQLWDAWVKRVRRRLQPRQAAPDYLLELRAKEPERAIDEVSQLLESALDEGVDGQSDGDYWRALVTTATHLVRSANSPYDVEALSALTLDFLRDLTVRDAGWGMVLANFIGNHLEQLGPMLDDDDELLLLDEADAILASQDDDPTKLRRIENRRRAARIQLNMRHVDTAAQIIAELAGIIARLAGKLTGEGRIDLLAAELDTALLRGDLSRQTGKVDVAKRLYEAGLKLTAGRNIASRADLARLQFDLHLRLARLDPEIISSDEAARHALDALEWAGSSNTFVLYAADLGEAVLRAENPALLAEFVARGFRAHERRQSQFVFYHGRNPRAAAKIVAFLRHAAMLVTSAASDEDALIYLLNDLSVILTMLGDRPPSRSNLDLQQQLELLIDVLRAGSPNMREHADRLTLAAERATRRSRSAK